MDTDLPKEESDAVNVAFHQRVKVIQPQSTSSLVKTWAVPLIDPSTTMFPSDVADDDIPS